MDLLTPLEKFFLTRFFHSPERLVSYIKTCLFMNSIHNMVNGDTEGNTGIQRVTGYYRGLQGIAE